VALLDPVRLTLIGKEQPLSLAQTCLFLQVAENFKRLGCRYSRLSYRDDGVELEAVTPSLESELEPSTDWLSSECGLLSATAACLGGRFQKRAIANQQGLQLSLNLPYELPKPVRQVKICCRQPLLQIAFTHLAHIAGIQVGISGPVITDDPAQVKTDQLVVWVSQPSMPTPSGVSACLDLSTTPEQFQEALDRVTSGKPWERGSVDSTPNLSEREREILNLLASGLRDRDIANELIISESTVKFHLNNVLSKLKARTRFQALHQALQKGLL
jgi:DNA-binding CsgD family transcriptional regulator